MCFYFFWRDWNLERYVFCIFFGFMNIWDMWYFIYDLWSIMIVFEISLIKIWLFCVFVFFFEEIEIRKDKVFVYFLVSWIFEICDILIMICEVLWWYLVYIFWFHEYLRYLIFQICFWSIMMIIKIWNILCCCFFFDEFEIWKDKVFE